MHTNMYSCISLTNCSTSLIHYCWAYFLKTSLLFGLAKARLKLQLNQAEHQPQLRRIYLLFCIFYFMIIDLLVNIGLRTFNAAFIFNWGEEGGSYLRYGFLVFIECLLNKACLLLPKTQFKYIHFAKIYDI